MVYETDFYTTRRPYTSSRPTITSYSVTRREVPWHKVPTVPRPSQVAPCFTVFGSRYLPGQTFHRNIPHIAHKKLVVIGPSAHSLHHIKQSAYLAEIDRIYHKTRPSLAYQPTEDYLNSRSIVSFDDETRSIRAKTAELLKRIHTPIPRAQRPMPLPGELKLLDDLTTLRNDITILTIRLVIFPRSYDDGAYYSHTELPISERISSDNYIDRLLSANREVQHNVLTMSHYDEPARHYNSIGKGHLACVSFAGGRPISKRRNLASPDDYIRDDIKVLSHYGRFRAAAEGAPHVPDTEYAPLPHRPPTKSSVTGSWKSNAPHKTERAEATPDHEPHIKANLTAGEEFDKALDKKQRRREAIEAAALREAEEEKRRKQELLRQEELAAQAAQERQEELERRARQEEEAQRLKEEEEIIARENAERLAAEKRAQDEADKKAKEEEERKAKEEAERLAKEEEARKAKEAKEAERKAKEEEERKAKEEADRLAKEEEERKAKEEAERLAKEEEERKAKEEAERLAKEEAERLAKEEEERKAKEEAERLAKEEEERKAKEEAERLAKEEEERKAKEEAERLAEEERLAKEAAENAVEESGPEPVVEEPQSPEDAPVENTDAPTAEEVEEEEEEEEE